VDGWLVRLLSYSEWILKGRLVSPGKPTNEKPRFGVKLAINIFFIVLIGNSIMTSFSAGGRPAG